MTINAAQRIDVSQIPLEDLAGNTSVSDQQKVAEVSRQFEAVLLRQIFQEIRKPVLDSSEASSTTTGIYSDMINNQLADSITRAGGLGLARSLSSQLSHQVLSGASPVLDSPPTPSSSPAGATTEEEPK